MNKITFIRLGLMRGFSATKNATLQTWLVFLAITLQSNKMLFTAKNAVTVKIIAEIS
jgi:hypothetical protein